MLTTISRLRLNAQGYDSLGSYWGVDAPLWQAWQENGDTHTMRAKNRADAIGQVRVKWPEAIFTPFEVRVYGSVNGTMVWSQPEHVPYAAPLLFHSGHRSWKGAARKLAELIAGHSDTAKSLRGVGRWWLVYNHQGERFSLNTLRERYRR